MKLVIIIFIAILLQSCTKIDDTVSPQENLNYKIVFISDRDSDGQIHIELGIKGEVYTMNIDGTNQTRITENDFWDTSPKYSPDGKKIVYASAIDWLMSYIYIMDSDGSHIINLGNGNYPTFSNDNSKVLYQTSGLMGIMNADGSNKKVLTDWADSIYSTLGQDFPLQFSSDDRRILFISNRNNNDDIYTMTIDGNDVKRLTNSEGYDGSCSFSPDNSKILFVSYRSGKAQIYIMDSNGNNQKQLTNTPEFNIRPTFSPDGAEIVFISNRDNSTEVYTMNTDGTNQKRLTNNSASKDSPHFSPDGLSIVYEQRQNNIIDIFIIMLKSNEIIDLTNGRGNNYRPYFKSSILKKSFSDLELI
ncbi:MAG: hypothetical protein A2315_03485 [Ignavibacteria bacterium RIFOXYB2_FULL_35_12]|nr:MAG: hypothetical protein A2058_10700 [Ignavibacteria bacterium GWA2_36_19]OGU52455.1 MAG: hypothetical protein A2006_12960 [Ignavibacteria bacterium GWC2_35_8]OGU63047.1 MAG: hypothetical protein A2X60_01085 [Ignavibacteria bacterium GWF2_35_20]OGU80247.1 MAG: hypothetical protein A2254_06700 [Ignavibacteria bacterium RIFOXYA2_FULL_35_9]OGU88964.1 MAG: hypothetical protein A3K31_01065 [Ignavibacteria bacterium RIFOXYA12_FULL_35_25]OGU90940.1 MAG: hypothetical protein A2492_05275 [Ignavibac